MPNRRRTWPYSGPELNRDPPSPVYFAVPDGYYRSDRAVAGPLRYGTTPEAGPNGQRVTVADRAYRSDYGMDRIDPNAAREINKGTSEPPPPIKSDLIAREIRSRR